MDGYIGGGVLESIVEKSPGLTAQQKLAHVWRELKGIFQKGVPDWQFSRRLNKLTFSMFQSDTASRTFANLRHMKAVHQRDVMVALYFLEKERVLHIDDPPPHMQHRFSMLEASSKMEQCINKSGPFEFRDKGKYEALLGICQDTLYHHSFVTHHAITKGLCRYNIAPKHHFVYELIWNSQWISPKFVNAYRTLLL